jgi:anti-anti-sigma regulatory factor
MTYRIDRVVIGQYHVILRISGRITGEGANVLRASLEEEKTAVAIDLKEVLLVDREAVKLLALHESNGAEITNCPLYIREWITRERNGR